MKRLRGPSAAAKLQKSEQLTTELVWVARLTVDAYRHMNDRIEDLELAVRRLESLVGRHEEPP